jgi:hypothetical protein
MFHKKQQAGPPPGPFPHTDDCKILRSDPTVVIPWNEVEGGLWVRQCVCTKEYWRAPAPSRQRLDPLDPATMRHLPQCEYASASDPAVLKLVLRVRDGADPSYVWVECLECTAGWQVPVYRPAGAAR